MKKILISALLLSLSGWAGTSAFFVFLIK